MATRIRKSSEEHIREMALEEQQRSALDHHTRRNAGTPDSALEGVTPVEKHEIAA